VSELERLNRQMNIVLVRRCTPQRMIQLLTAAVLAKLVGKEQLHPSQHMTNCEIDVQEHCERPEMHGCAVWDGLNCKCDELKECCFGC